MRWKLAPRGVQIIRDGIGTQREDFTAGGGKLNSCKEQDAECEEKDVGHEPGTSSARQNQSGFQDTDRDRDVEEPAAAEEPKISAPEQQTGTGVKTSSNAERAPQTPISPKVIQDIEHQLRQAILKAHQRSGRDDNPRKQQNRTLPRRIKNVASRSPNKSLHPRLSLLLSSESLEAQIFTLLGTLLFSPAANGGRRSILLTCVNPGEILLMDCDLRKSHLFEFFGVGRLPGFSAHLASGAPLSGKVHPVGLENLHVMYTGTSGVKNMDAGRSLPEIKAVLTDCLENFSTRTVLLEAARFRFRLEDLNNADQNEAERIDDILLLIDYGAMSQRSSGDILNIVGRDRILGTVDEMHGKIFLARQMNRYQRLFRQGQ